MAQQQRTCSCEGLEVQLSGRPQASGTVDKAADYRPKNAEYESIIKKKRTVYNYHLCS